MISALERFWAKVDKSGDCWVWTAAVTHSRSSDYGSFWFRGSTRPAHRWIYEQTRGIVTPDLRIDHLCRNTLCVRPDHLEAVSERDNILRGEAPSAKNARKTHCANGHEFTADNTLIRPCGRRKCRACAAASRAFRTAA